MNDVIVAIGLTLILAVGALTSQYLDNQKLELCLKSLPAGADIKTCMVKK